MKASNATRGARFRPIFFSAAALFSAALALPASAQVPPPPVAPVAAAAATVPGAPTIGTATAGNAQVSVTFTAPSSNGGEPIYEYFMSCSTAGDSVIAGVITGRGSPLTVSDLVNGKAYTCSVGARNAVGFGPVSATSNSVTPVFPPAPVGATRPGAPTIGTATAFGTQVVVTFTAPGSDGGATITQYLMSCGSAEGTVASVITGPASPLIATGVESGTYTCRVGARNAVGFGPYSAGSNDVRLRAPSAPVGATHPGAPTIGTLTATGGGEDLRVTFTAPGSDGGADIIQYKMSCSTEAGVFAREITGPASSPLTMTNLTIGARGTAYKCMVSARNAVAFGPYSAASNSVTLVYARATVPGAPTIRSASYINVGALVSFTPTPSSNNGGAVITGYTATCSSASHTASGNEVWPSGSLIVRGLKSGTTYTCSVTATNSVGTGPASSPASNSVLIIGAPDMPTIRSATAHDGQVRVNYTAPSNNGGSPITRYVGRCTATGSPTHVSMGTTDLRTAPDSPLTVTVLALQNGRAYTCTVRADNLAGEGPHSAASNSVTPVAPGAPVARVAPVALGAPVARVTVSPPGAPTNVSAKPGKGEVMVTFTAPSNDGGTRIATYRAVCGTSASGGVVGANAGDGPASPLTVKGLVRGTEYICTVNARNTAGLGMGSKASNNVKPD